jgi:hypothetical protein
MNGADAHCAAGPVGTTSVWPAKTNSGLLVPRRAHRLVTPFDVIVSQTNPMGASRAISCAWQSLSSGVTDERAIRDLANARVGESLI